MWATGPVEYDPKGIENRVRDAMDLGMNMLRVRAGASTNMTCSTGCAIAWASLSGRTSCRLGHVPEEAPYPALVEAERGTRLRT